MKSFKQTLFIILLGSFWAITMQAQENTTYFLHTIEKGQSLYSIASMYEVSQEDIIKLNPGSEEKIYVGKALKIPQNKKEKVEAKKEIFHTIQAGENLYRLSKLYNVPVKDVMSENPGLTAENFKIGKVIRIPIEKEIAEEAEKEVAPVIPPTVIPRCKEMHKVKRKETIFSVSKEYGISEESLIAANPELKDGMKRGQLLCIPYPTPITLKEKKEEPLIAPSDSELFRENQEKANKIASIKAAIILPFLAEGDSKGESAKMIEFYEGFLMAVHNLKQNGVSMDIYAYNSGNKQSSINEVLEKEELKQMDIIFGPLYPEHIKPLSDFAEAHDIRLVIPTTRANEVFQNPLIYQVNPPQSYLYSEVYEHFNRNFINPNVIIIDMGTNEKDKSEFIGGLKEELAKQKRTVQTVNGNNISVEALKSALKPGRQNIFIPTSGSNVTLIKILPHLKMLAREDVNYKVTLFGYPEWQTYTADHLDSFFELDTYFYSYFYTNNLLPSAKEFVNSYHRWYSKEMGNTFPKYGMWGYDTAYFFLRGLAEHGTGLEANIQKINYQSIQTGFKFSRVNNWGGFINKKVYFIHLTKDYELIKMDFD